MRARFAIAVVQCAVVLAIASEAQQPAPKAQDGGYQISGVVVAANGGQPLNNATVIIALATHRESVQSVKTGTDGRFAFHGLVAGKYAMSAARRGYPEQGFNQHEDYSTAIVVGPDIAAENLVFRLRPEAVIRGRVIDESEEPVQGAFVQLFTRRIQEGRLQTRIHATTNTDDRGHYAFSHLIEGTYYVAVSGRPWYSEGVGMARQQRAQRKLTGSADTTTPDNTETEQQWADLDRAYPFTFYDGVPTSAEASAIDLQAGQNMVVDINLRSVPAIHVRVPRQPEPPESKDAASDDGAQSVFNPPSRHYQQPPRVQLFYSVFDDLLVNADTQMMGGPDGYELAGMAPGRYIMQVVKQGEGKQEGSYQEINLSGDTELPTGAAPLVAVEGTAQFDGGAHSILAVMLVNRQTSTRYWAPLGEKGEFRFEEMLMPGKYDIVVGGSPELYLKSVTASGARVSGRTLEIKGGEPVQLGLKLGRGLTQLDGTALRDGKPFAGAMILLVPRDAENNALLHRRDQSDSDGTFTLYNVVPGEYTLVAIEDGWRLTWTDPKVLEHFAGLGTTLHVDPGAKKDVPVVVQKPW